MHSQICTPVEDSGTCVNVGHRESEPPVDRWICFVQENQVPDYLNAADSSTKRDEIISLNQNFKEGCTT